MIYIGIDCGVTGAVAVLDGEHPPVVIDTPTLKIGGKREYDLAAMRDLLSDAAACDEQTPPTVHVAIERQQVFPKQGAVSGFTIGYGFAAWVATVVGLHLSYEIVGPRTWQAVMLRDMPKPVPNKKTGAKSTKEMSLLKAKHLWPQLPTLSNHNHADALLLAEYIRRLHH